MRGMNTESDNTPDNHFDPCHSDGIPGGCSSCEHHDECVPPSTDDDFFRDPMEPHPSDGLLVVDDGEQLTLFDVSDYVSTDDDDDLFEEFDESCFCVDLDASYVHLDGDAGPKRIPLEEYLDGFGSWVRSETIREMVDNFEPLIPLEGQCSVGFFGGKLYLATPGQMATLRETAEFMHSLECDCGDEDDS